MDSSSNTPSAPALRNHQSPCSGHFRNLRPPNSPTLQRPERFDSLDQKRWRRLRLSSIDERGGGCLSVHWRAGSGPASVQAIKVNKMCARKGKMLDAAVGPGNSRTYIDKQQSEMVNLGLKGGEVRRVVVSRVRFLTRCVEGVWKHGHPVGTRIMDEHIMSTSIRQMALLTHDHYHSCKVFIVSIAHAETSKSIERTSSWIYTSYSSRTSPLHHPHQYSHHKRPFLIRGP